MAQCRSVACQKSGDYKAPPGRLHIEACRLDLLDSFYTQLKNGILELSNFHLLALVPAYPRGNPIIYPVTRSSLSGMVPLRPSEPESSKAVQLLSVNREYAGKLFLPVNPLHFAPNGSIIQKIQFRSAARCRHIGEPFD